MGSLLHYVYLDSRGKRLPVSLSTRATPTETAGPVAVTLGGLDGYAPGSGRRGAGRISGKGWLRLISPLVAIGLWQIGSSTGIIPATKLASPGKIADTAYQLIVTNSPAYGTLQGSLLVSLERWAIGCSIGVTVGMALGLVSGFSRPGETALDPVMQALRSVPLFGLIPLFIIWFGIGELPKVMLVMLAAAFLMYVSTFAGIRSVDGKLAELGQVLGLSRREQIRHIVLPGALPEMLTGLRLSLVASLLALVVAEQINANQGLGFILNQGEQFLQNNIIVVVLIVYAILGLLADAVVRLIERKALKWRRGFME
jgi:sulfonate transport system permease protein